jgi:hypothetical protein
MSDAAGELPAVDAAHANLDSTRTNESRAGRD